MRMCTISVITVALIFSASRVCAGDRTTVVIFDIEAKKVDLSKDVLLHLADYVAGRITKTGKAKAMPRVQLRKKLWEAAKASYKECYDEKCQIELGRELAAQKALSTRVFAIGDECRVTFSLYDLKLSAIENSVTVVGGCDQAAIAKGIDVGIAQLYDMRFDLVVRSSPQGGDVSYKRTGDPYQAHSENTDTIIRSLVYAIWTVRVRRKGYKDQKKIHDPFREKNHVLFFILEKK